MKLFTYGYSGRQVVGLESALLAMPAALLVDVRWSPRSRMPQWSGAALRRVFGPRYLHLPHFGNRNYKTDGPVELVNPAAGVQALVEAMGRFDPREEPVAVLLCACRVRAGCHREDVVRVLTDAVGAVDAGELFDAPRPAEPPAWELFPTPPRV